MHAFFIVPTPIGNLEDMTFRAVEVLKSVDYILCEDTRVSSKLLHHYNIQTPLVSFHQHNEHKTLERHIEALQEGKTIAQISDAGTPGVSDPGFLMARACMENDIAFTTLPGATAFVPALVNSGLPCEKFVFEGFLPHKKGRQTRLELLSSDERTFVLYESPYRIVKTLEQLVTFCGADRKASISREISKKFEETINGTLLELKSHFTSQQPKGEFVIVVNGSKNK